MNSSKTAKPKSEYNKSDVKDDSESESLRNDDDQFNDETNVDGDESTAIHNNLDPNSQQAKRSKSKDRSNIKKGGKKKKRKNKKRSDDRDQRSRVGAGGGGDNVDQDLDEDGYPRHKYSTADQPQTSRCKRYCWIFLMFLAMLLFMILISKLMEYFFFNKKSDNKDIAEFARDPNSTFPLGKFDIDSACSRGQIAADEGALCKNVCMPVYYECCDPFNEFDLYESYQTLPPTFVNDTNATTYDDDQFLDGMNETDYAHRYNNTNTTELDGNNTTLTGLGGSNTTDADKNSTTSNSTVPPNTDTNATAAPSSKPSAVDSATRFIRKYKVRRRYLQYQEQDEFDAPVEQELSPDEIALRVLQGGEYNVPLTVAPVWWTDEKKKLDDAVAAKANQTCSVSRETEGCVRYAKCQAMNLKVPPAPANLPTMCSTEALRLDPGGCQDICSTDGVACCMAKDSTNCIASSFDVCLDYAPCQNLRSDEDTGGLSIPAASQTLDQQCLYQQQPCLDECKVAESCSSRNSLSYQVNFITCLTYAPCNNITSTHIYVPPQFNYLDQPPEELLTACKRPGTNATAGNGGVFVLEDPTKKPCKELCEPAKCCWASTPSDSCFMDDPLGCLAWEQQCQILLDYPQL
jgi:hypothetical protein